MFGSNMKKLLIPIFTLFLMSCSYYTTKAPLKTLSEKYDPSKLNLNQGYNSYVKNMHLEDGTEIGIIYLKDGTQSKYWFRSHHLVDDIGGTWFAMGNGQKKYMAGWFCCEVQLPKEQLASLKDLESFINEHHGISP